MENRHRGTLKVLVANRGEIAIRIYKTLQKMGIHTLGIQASFEKNPLHIQYCDSHETLVGKNLSDTYLNIEKIIDTAKGSQCGFIHPGYGFLAENPGFAERCEQEGIVFIGPSAAQIRALGDKEEAKKIAETLGIPVLKAISADGLGPDGAAKLEFPLLIKASKGGGGRGMRIVWEPEGLDGYLDIARSESLKFFGSDKVYLEKYIERPRHIEVQVLGDRFGNIVHLFERECTIQRRFQKIIEEAPAQKLSEGTKDRLYQSAVELARSVGYQSAGTVEFLVDGDENIYFLEVNTRIQVEHPVTEMLTGIDIVKEQMNIALGHPIPFSQKDIRINGHAIECRVCTEDPENGFVPSLGKVWLHEHAHDAGTQLYASCQTGCEIGPFFDPMVAKALAWGNNRAEAINKMLGLLSHYHIHGVKHNIAYLLNILRNNDFLSYHFSTAFLSQNEGLAHMDHKDLPETVLFASVFLSKTKPYRQKGFDGFWRPFYLFNGVLNGLANKFLVSERKGMLNISCSGNTHAIEVVDGKGPVYDLNFLKNNYKIACSTDHKGKYYVSYKGWVHEIMFFDETHYDPGGPASISSIVDGRVVSPLHGKVVKIVSSLNKIVKQGDILMVIESMKIENAITAPKNGTVCKIDVSEGEQVEANRVLMEIK
jgi:3-methylcrotonyl-CoA carboxylase alpha subunit